MFEHQANNMLEESNKCFDVVLEELPVFTEDGMKLPLNGETTGGSESQLNSDLQSEVKVVASIKGKCCC